MKGDSAGIWLVIVLLAVGAWFYFGQDTYVGFYYPNPDDLSRDIQSDEKFKSLEACRVWVDEQSRRYNADGLPFDYECGKNCDLSGGKPYVCEETLE